MLQERNANKEGDISPAAASVDELRQALMEHGIADERITEALTQLDTFAAEPQNGNGNGGNGIDASNGSNGNGAASVGIPHMRAPLSRNARIIMEQRYLMKSADGLPIETPDDLFHRVANAVAQGEKPAVRDVWAERFYNLMSSLKFLPNSPTLVNAGAGGKGCLSACFVISPDDNMDSIMQVATDAAMIEKWGGGIGFGFSRLRPKQDRIATTHGEACGPIAVMKLYSSVGATLTQGAFRLGAHMGQLIITHPDVQEFIHCKDDDDTLANFNISVQVTDAFMRAVDADEDWTFYNPRDTGDGPLNEPAGTVRARDLWREICESAWKTGDPGVVFIDRVWDTQPNPQMGNIQTSNPCGEEFLENYGNCCLGSINLDKHVSGEGFDWETLGATVRAAVRFLDDVIEVNQFPMDKLRDVNLATRRIGLGVMGWADALLRLGIPYDSARALELTEEVAGFIHNIAWDESGRLAFERDPFPEYEGSALKERGMPPMRHSSVITIAPTGTISRIADCSSGIEPHFANAWWSNVLWKDQDGTSERMLDAPKSVWEALRARFADEDKVRSVLRQLADSPENAERIFTQHGINPARFRTSMLISPEAHVRMQAAWQKYVTNSVSKTINMPNSATVKDVHDAYYLAWKSGCKAVTVYRDGSKAMQVLETGKDTEKALATAPASNEPSKDENGFLVPRERPAAVLGITERVRTGHGTMYVTVNFDEGNKPFELFTAIGKAGGSEPAHLEGLSRMVSLCLRSGVDPNAIIYHLSGITSEPVWDNGVLIRSAEDGVAHVLKRHINGPNTPSLPSGEVESESVAQLGLFTAPKFPAAEGASYIPNFALSGKCPKCQGRIVPQEGCLRCLECGYTKCE